MWVDVVTAVHAEYAGYLPAAWDSLHRQRHPHWTWRVQVDGPPGEVLDALAACGAADDGRVRIAAHGTDEGPAVTRNIALGSCTAPLVQNLDADDELEPGALAALSGALATHTHAGYAVGHARDLHADGTLRTAPLAVPAGPLARGALAVAWASALPDRTLPPVHPAGVMWRRNLLLAVGGWAALRGVEDTATLIAGSALATGILLDVPTLRYRRHDAQRSRRNSNFSGGGLSICLFGSAPPCSRPDLPGKIGTEGFTPTSGFTTSFGPRHAHRPPSSSIPGQSGLRSTNLPSAAKPPQ
ncbi:glycosyltransferase [Protofrankia coriariae]|uniref:glycosyltransferase n=1 Tax=Protofrankia coriariae TaxID=1562887 RepID=UPI000AFE5030|nr:glycosyltransferase [Protofrankia coriariae]